jgi:hypothetical protein
LKDRADVVMEGAYGAGVAELIEHIVKDDLRSFELILHS